jgi:hypothetical protein
VNSRLPRPDHGAPLYGALRERLRAVDRLIHRHHRLYDQDPEFATRAD